MLSNGKRLWMAVFLVLVMAMAVGCSTATGTAKAETAKEAAWQFHDITGIDLVKQYARVPQPEGAMIIDSRPYKPKYIKGHIPTAVSMPYSQFDKQIDKLPKDKNDLLIFYCGGPT